MKPTKRKKNVRNEENLPRPPLPRPAVQKKDVIQKDVVSTATIKVSRCGIGLTALKRRSKTGVKKVGNVLINKIEMEPGGQYDVQFTEEVAKLMRNKTIHVIGRVRRGSR